MGHFNMNINCKNCNEEMTFITTVDQEDGCGYMKFDYDLFYCENCGILLEEDYKTHHEWWIPNEINREQGED